MKINDKLISIPPYISTTWDNVAALQKDGSKCIIVLIDGSRVEVPDLSEEVIERLFDQHATIIEQQEEEEEPESAQNPFQGLSGLGDSFQLGLTGIDGMSSVMGHNPDQSDGPILPPELLSKVAQLAKLVAPQNLEELPKAEPHCNCVYCQVARALRSEMGEEAEELEEITSEADAEEVSEEDLNFQQWDIKQTAEHMFEVTNRLDAHEVYHVHLAEPVGCTCGVANCEHLLAVLRS
jgi:hypothetical protein